MHHNSRSDIVTIRSSKGQTLMDIRQIWDFRYLLRTLVWRELKARYRHTALGVFWFVLQPFVLMLVISIGLRFAFPGDLDGLPYPLYVASGLVLWVYFYNSFPAGSTSLETYRGMLTKISFPHACLPMVPAITAIVDMFAASLLLIPMLIFYDTLPSWRIIFLPLVIFGMFLFVYGLSLLASASSAVYKDLRHIIPFFSQIMFFASPVFISHAHLPKGVGIAFLMNPFSAYLDAFRWMIFPTSTAPDLLAVALAIAITLIILLVGLLYFQRQQSNLVDIL